MNRWTILTASLLGLLLSLSCSGGNPATPNPDLKPAAVPETADQDSQTHLWGFYDVYIDIPTQTATATLNRSGMFTANVVNFINGKPAGLAFKINGTPAGSDYVDVDIDITITHPFPGLTEYNGYDVRGIFMGDGSGSMDYNPDLKYPVLGTDQFMLASPADGDGGPDGYSRWFNKAEFSKGGSPLFQYTQGKVATPGYSGTATLCPYKYYADLLYTDDDLWAWLVNPGNGNSNSVFGAGKSNTRNYYLRFPNAKGVKYSYAILANWKGTGGADHPANAPEAVGVKVVDESTVYYVSQAVKGGNLIFDVSLWDWDSDVSLNGVMEDYTIFIESTVLSGVHEASVSEMTPIGGGDNYSTYHFDLPADNITDPDNNSYWIIAECADENYVNALGGNDAGTDPLAAIFKLDLMVSSDTTPPVAVVVAEPNPQSECVAIHFDGLDSYDPDGGTIQKYEWDWNNDGVYDEEGAEVYHSWETQGNYMVQLRVTDDEGLTDTLNTPLEITIEPAAGWAETWGGDNYDTSYAIALDASGNIYVAGIFVGIDVDFDPGPGTDLHSSTGYSEDVFLSKFDPSGDFAWAKTFGGSGTDRGYRLQTDSSGVYIAGFFDSSDFDPGDGNPVSTKGGWDCWMSKFDFDGTCLWAKTWGGSNHDHLYACATDGSGGVYVGGGFTSSDMDFDPGSGVENQPSNGTWDSWVSKLNSDGEFQWAGVWGWWYDESVNGLAANSGNVYCSGNYGGDVDFDPDPGSSDNHSSYGWYLDAFVSCFNTSGVYQWVKTWEGDGDERAWQLSLDTTGNIYAAGVVSGGIDLNPDLPYPTNPYYSQGDWDIWLCKLDSTGSFLWGKGWGGYYADMPYGMASDGSDNVYVTGYFRSPFIDFDPSGGDDTHNNAGSWNGEADIYLSKFDSSGNFDWAQTWGSPSQDIGQDVVAGPCDTSFLTGSFSGSVDFDPGAGTDQHDSNSYTEDVFLLKLLSDGEY